MLIRKISKCLKILCRVFEKTSIVWQAAIGLGNNELTQYQTASIFNQGVNTYPHFSVNVEIPLRPNRAYFVNDVFWRTFLFIVNAFLRHYMFFGYLFHHNDGLNPDIRINLISTLYQYLFIDEIPAALRDGIFQEFGRIQREYDDFRDFRERQQREARERARQKGKGKGKGKRRDNLK